MKCAHVIGKTTKLKRKCNVQISRTIPV